MSAKDFVFGFTIAGDLASSFTSSFTGAADHIKELDKAIRANVDMMGNLDRAMKNGIISQASYTQGVAKLNQEMQQLSLKKDLAGQVNQMHNNFSKAGQSLASATKWAVGFGAALAIPINQARDFESSMADVKKVVDFDTPQQFKQMSNDILEMSSKMPMAAKDIAQIVAAGGQAGIAANELASFAESAVKMGIAFDTTAETAGDMMANWRTAFKMNQTEVVELADKINYLGNSTTANAMDISNMVTRVGALGGAAGVASGEIAAIGAAIIGTGTAPEIAATGFKNMALAMNAGASATKGQAAAFEQLGMNARDVAKRMQTDAKGAIIDVLEAIKRLPKEQQTAALTGLFGKESVTAIAPLLTNLEQLKDNFDKVGNSANYAGSMTAEYKARCETTTNQMDLLSNNVTALSINLGSAMLPAFNDLLKPLTDLANKFADWAKDHQDLIQDVIKLTAMIVGLTVAVKLSIAVWNVAKGVYAGVKIAITGMRLAYLLCTGQLSLFNIQQTIATGRLILYNTLSKMAAIGTGLMTAAQWALNAAMTANPIGLVIVGIAGLIAIGYAMYNYWQEIAQFLTNMWDSPITKIVLFCTGPIGWLIAAGLAIIANWESVKQWFITLWENPGQAIQQFVDGAKSLLGGLCDWAMDKWKGIKEFFSQPITATVKKVFSGGDDGGGEPKHHNAQGGIYDKGYFVTSFAEESGESAIPHTPNARNIGLLAKTNEIMGNPLGVGKQQVLATGGGTINLNYSPVINLGGGDDNSEGSIKAQLEDALQQQVLDLQRMIQDLQDQQRRVSYA